MKFKKIMAKALSWGLHAAAISALIALFLPIAVWYHNAEPLWGVDFYYTASLLNLIKNNLTLLPSAWNYAWSSGWPIQLNYPVLYYYLLLPLTMFFFVLDAIKIGNLISLMCFFAGCYMCFFAISKSRVIAFILAAAGIFSVGVYGALMWGGSLPNHASMLFYPWVTFFLIRYLEKHNVRFFASAVLLTGISILTHPQIPIAYVYPTSAILILFYPGGKRIWTRIKTLVLYFLVSFIIGLPLLYTSVSSVGGIFGNLVKTDAKNESISTVSIPVKDPDIVAFQRRQPWRIVEDTHPALFVFNGVAIVAFLLSLVAARSKKSLLTPVLFLGLAVFYSVYIVVFAYGVSVFHGGWYRLFWSVPFVYGMVAAAFWGSAILHVQKKFSKKSGYFVLGILNAILIALALVIIPRYSQDVKEKIALRSNPSSAFPDKLNMWQTSEELTKLKKELVPEWLDTENTQYRVYSGDQTFNIWWSALYKMPIARGYLDPPKSDFLFWLDASLSRTPEGEDQLVKSFGYPPDVALRNTLYLIDWYAVKYFEGGRESQTAFAPMPKSLDTDEYVSQRTLLDFNDEKYTETNNTLKYHEFKDQLVSPILIGTSAPVVGVVSSDDGYNTVVRALADAGYGLRHVIPVRLGKELDKVSADDLEVVDVLILYDYSYYNKNKSFRKIEQFVKNGSNVYIESGIETKEANSQNLPELYPLRNSIRKQLGKEWDLEFQTEDFSKADITSFSPPVFDDDAWNFSIPETETQLDQESQVILTNYDQPVMIRKSMGKGTVVWSGMNFLYHVIRYHNESEIHLLTDILDQVAPGVSESTLVEGTADFISSQKREFEVSNAKGILLKEQAYPGWSSFIEGDSKKANTRIYAAGPAYPGFMYVSVPKEWRNQRVKVTFAYHGDKYRWIFFIVSVTVSSVLISIAVFGRFVGNQFISQKLKKMSRFFGKWWEREE